MRQLRGRSAALVLALAMGTLALAGCGHNAASKTPPPAAVNPASAPSGAPASSGGGGYGY